MTDPLDWVALPARLALTPRPNHLYLGSVEVRYWIDPSTSYMGGRS